MSSTPVEDTWCGHLKYRITAHLCGPPGVSDQMVQCVADGCGREYMASFVEAAKRARDAPAEAERCIHELLKADCGDCTPRKPRQRAKPAARTAPAGYFAARYPGRCGADRAHGIEPGDMICRDDGGGYLCQDCGP